MRQSVAMVLGGLLLAVVGCGGSSSPEAQLAGTWTYINGYSGIGLTFSTDSTYVAQVLQVTSSTSAEDEIEKGVYSVSGNDIIWTPQEYTCPGPDPVYTTPYSFSGGNLVVVTPGNSAVVTFSRDTSSGSGNESLVFGCFQSGSFAQQSLAPVSN